MILKKQMKKFKALAAPVLAWLDAGAKGAKFTFSQEAMWDDTDSTARPQTCIIGAIVKMAKNEGKLKKISMDNCIHDLSHKYPFIENVIREVGYGWTDEITPENAAIALRKALEAKDDFDVDHIWDHVSD